MIQGGRLLDGDLLGPLLEHHVLGVQPDLGRIHGAAADTEGHHSQRPTDPQAHLGGGDQQVLGLPRAGKGARQPGDGAAFPAR